MFSSPLVRRFCWTERVQERKGLHAFFYGDIPDLLQIGDAPRDAWMDAG